MKTVTDAIVDVLARAESDLLGLVAESATRGDYEAIERSRLAAHGVRALLVQMRPLALPVGDNGHATGNAVSCSTRIDRPVVATKGKGGYPHFVVRGKTLIKTGWSKKHRCEYQHKTDRDSFDRVAACMAGMASGEQGPFTAERIADAVAADGHPSMPIYKLYVAMSLLKHSGVVRQIGREGYLFDPTVATQSAAIWRQLEAKNSPVSAGKRGHA